MRQCGLAVTGPTQVSCASLIKLSLDGRSYPSSLPKPEQSGILVLSRAKDPKGGQTATICGASVYGRPSDVMLFLLYPHTHVCKPGLTLKPKYTNGFLAFPALSLSLLDRYAACSSFRLMRGVSLRLFLLSFTSEAQSPSRSKPCLCLAHGCAIELLRFLLYSVSAVCCDFDVLLSADMGTLERITHAGLTKCIGR